jgi:hypothetical protein
MWKQSGPCGIRVSPVASDWATKGAHLHVGADEVRVFPTGDGGIGAEGIRLRTGMVSDRSVQQVLDTLRNSPELRQDVITEARSAMEHMNDHHWGNDKSRAAEMNFPIKALTWRWAVRAGRSRRDRPGEAACPVRAVRPGGA